MTKRTTRPLRADAARNRAKILDAARRQITRHGPDVGMDEIAADAGVAVGTLYGHFQTKVDLVAAVVTEYLTQVADRSERAVAAVDNGLPAFEELVALLNDIVSATANNQAAKAAANALAANAANSSDQRLMQRAGTAMQAIIDRAQSEKTVRADLKIDDLYLLVSNIPAGYSADVLNRWTDLMLNGIAASYR
ncbi:Transcriptional regulator, TetR [Rhodococcus sp. B7740]|uniref:TetR/AcrR family transcriptional regulator n=1 Tax=Rhodococcus sp. B7740 TaxID=1564114 RepID=UPI0005D7B9B1|nr:TetR/AcrR family transcriptional regulator [Rhodococcus sp. B7740]AJW40208.1 Transcriptional regulator, TetR [Rhodococcus sp. B7740]